MSTELATTDSTTTALYNASNYTTFEADTTEKRKLAANAINNAESLSDHEGEVLDVIGIMTMPGVRKARQVGQADMPCTNTYLICEGGRAYFSQSEGVRRAADSFLALGIFEDGEVVKMHVESKVMANGNSLKTLVLD